ncbi:helix-turn-helix domain-containing protein [Yoonia maricola]|nr:XRE family transcriptional regulator [Yoonia maricola]
MPDDRITVPSLGADVRAIRKARKMTLVDLSDALGRSVGWLSQVERDMSYPSIADLNRIASILDVSVSSFLQVGVAPDEAGVVVRAHARRPIGSRTAGLTEALLSPDLTDDFEVIHSTFAPHSHLTEPLSRPTQEVCYIVSGQFEVALDGTHFLLEAGDSFRLRGEQFQWWNRHDTPCEIIWVISPPIY